jgi:hypothetical protein
MSALAPVASARDSTFRITLILRGHVASDVGFSLAAGGILFGAFCEFQGIRDEEEAENPGAPPLAPLCKRDVRYTITLTADARETLDYSISKFWLRDARTLWTGTVTGDGRDHTLTYVYLFDLPATDTASPSPGMRGVLPASLARRAS